MDSLDALALNRTPTPARPLPGLTVLLVEDSRFASEALRLICLRSGARIRRADTMAHARRHLSVYRPGCVIVDLGLPDGSGTDLIAEMAGATPRIDIILGTSGDPDARPRALAAGADGFLDKPVHSVARFQALVLGLLPPDRRPAGPRPVGDDLVEPDAVAYRDDLLIAAGALAGPDGPEIDYVTQFLAGIARSAGDAPLLAAVQALAATRRTSPARRDGLGRLSQMVKARLVPTTPL